MIKLLLLIPTLDRSGAEKQFSLLATRLPKDEFDVHAVALTRSGPYEALLREHNIPLTVLGKRWKFDPLCLLRLKRLISRINPDIVHSWLFAANAAARLVAGKKPKPKVIISERCVDRWKSGWQLALDRRQIQRTTRLIGNSVGVLMEVKFVVAEVFKWAEGSRGTEKGRLDARGGGRSDALASGKPKTENQSR